MAGSKGTPKTPVKKKGWSEEEVKRGQGSPYLRAPKVAKLIVNPRGQRKGR